MARKVFMTVWDIDVNKGGINKAMLRRSSLFDNENYSSELLTMDYKTNYKEIEDYLRKSGQLSPNVNITNVYDYYRDKNTLDDISNEQKEFYNTICEVYEKDFWVENHGDYARYYKNGIYVKYKRWRKDRTLSHIDYFSPTRIRIKREEYHKEGYKIRELYYHPSNNEVNQELYFTKDGFCYLTKWFNYTNGSQQKVCLFSPNSKDVIDFKNNSEFHVYWLNELCKSESLKPIMICDGPGSAIKVMRMEEELAYKVYVIHSNHFDSPHTFGSPIKKNHEELLNNIVNGDPIIVLTGEQKEDLIKQFGDYGNIYVIPHFIKSTSVDVEKDSLLVSMVARYHPEKRINEAIEAFGKVVQEIPNAILNIYGDGDHKHSLQELINKLNLNKNVFLKGYTDNVSMVFAKSSVSLLTSKYEGFSFVILESLINKTPVISYDIKYGPSNIIDDGINGYLVPNNDKELLAQKIVYLLKNHELAVEMGKKGFLKILNEYSEKKHYEQWENLFNTLTME